MSNNCTSDPVMEDHFTFESRYLPSRTKLFRIRTSDQTEWTVFDEWKTAKNNEKVVCLQRLTFRKENFYNKCYRINLSIRSACGNVQEELNIPPEIAKTHLTKIIIPSKRFKEIKVKKILKCPCEECTYNRQFLYGKELADIFRYDITITHLKDLPADPSKIPQREGLFTLSDPMSCILQNGHFSDFSIYCQNYSIKVHKNILSTRIPYFRRLLSSGMEEARSNRVRFEDINITTLREMLHFVYSGVLKPVTLTVVHDLFVLSDKFWMEDLKTLCSDIMCSHISYHNAASFLNLADRHQADTLKNSCVLFIAQNFRMVKHFDREFVNLDETLLSLIEMTKKFSRSINISR